MCVKYLRYCTVPLFVCRHQSAGESLRANPSTPTRGARPRGQGTAVAGGELQVVVRATQTRGHRHHPERLGFHITAHTSRVRRVFKNINKKKKLVIKTLDLGVV